MLSKYMIDEQLVDRVLFSVEMLIDDALVLILNYSIEIVFLTYKISYMRNNFSNVLFI